ncbi:MAG: glycosyltransferase family protein [Candidatus Diapherotrites archaeon]
MKALFFVCGEGLGHSTRCHALAKELRKKAWNVSIGAYGYSKTYFEKNGFDTVEIPNEISLQGKSGILNLGDSIKESMKPHKIFHFSKLLKVIEREKPDVIIGDGYFSAILAARMKKIPSILVLQKNQLCLGHLFKDRQAGVKLVGSAIKGITEFITKYADAVAICDYPAPYTVGEVDAWFSLKQAEKIHFLGPFVRKQPNEVKAAKAKKPLVVSLVGAFGYREKVFHKVIDAAKGLPKINFVLFSGPNIQLKSKVPKNVKVLPDSDPFEYYKAADLVIAAGGHSILMESLVYGKPLLSFPDLMHAEQQSNADGLERIGVGKKVGYDTPTFVLQDLIEDALKDKKMKAKAEKLQKYAQKLKPAQEFEKLARETIGKKSQVKK